MKPIIDVDPSWIISTGTTKISGYTTRLTAEAISEVNRNGNYLRGTTDIIIDEAAPNWSSFKLIDEDSNISCYLFETTSGTFFIRRGLTDRNHCESECSNPNHYASVVIYSPSNVAYGICSQIADKYDGNNADFAWVKKYIFWPEKYHELRTRDKCFGQTIKKIIEKRKV